MADFTSSDEDMGRGLGELAPYQTVITEEEATEAVAEPTTEFWLSFASKRYFKSRTKPDPVTFRRTKSEKSVASQTSQKCAVLMKKDRN
jgi:murein L,D-transpeptidase YafK